MGSTPARAARCVCTSLVSFLQRLLVSCYFSALHFIDLFEHFFIIPIIETTNFQPSSHLPFCSILLSHSYHSILFFLSLFHLPTQGFFRRCLTQGMHHKCAVDERCTITPFSRNSCQFCRLKKCFFVGMSREGAWGAWGVWVF